MPKIAGSGTLAEPGAAPRGIPGGVHAGAAHNITLPCLLLHVLSPPACLLPLTKRMTVGWATTGAWQLWRWGSRRVCGLRNPGATPSEPCQRRAVVAHRAGRCVTGTHRAATGSVAGAQSVPRQSHVPQTSREGRGLGFRALDAPECMQSSPDRSGCNPGALQLGSCEP